MQVELDQFHRPKTLTLGGQYEPQQRHTDGWSPYELNGGNVAAYVQHDWAVLAADTRLTRDYSILKRDATKIHKLTDTAWMLSAGMYADYTALWREMDTRIEQYSLRHQMAPSARALAELLAKVLYSRRFFPYYAFCGLVGFEDGKAHCWGYDAVGSHERLSYMAQGKASEMMLPLMDNQLGAGRSASARPTPDEAIEVMIDVFQSTAERDTTCGDNIEMIFLRAGQPPIIRKVPLRHD